MTPSKIHIHHTDNKDESYDALFVGRRIREMRKAKNMSIPVLAERADLSSGLISQVERGLTSPSIRSLRQIGVGLEVPVEQFFTPAPEAGDASGNVVVRPGSRRLLLLPHQGMYTELLTLGSGGALQAFIANIEPGGGSGLEFDTHEGEEAGLVLGGRLELWVGGERLLMDEGASFRFSSKLPHRYRNPGSVPTRVHWIITPPIY
jgi:transcriptional regulator with XRE-family HTH domain